MTTPPGSPLRTLGSAAPWTAAGYLASHAVVGSALFVVVTTVVLTTFGLAVLSIGLPLLIGAALVVRGCAGVERHRLRLTGVPLAVAYRPAARAGLLARIRAAWTDPVVLRDCAYLILLYPLLVLLDLLGLTLWLACVAGVTLPLWFWLNPPTWHDGVREPGVKLGYFPADGTGTGVFVGDLPTALWVAAVFLVLAVGVAWLVVAIARLHSWFARRLLGPRQDPLATAKAVLAAPGPLENANRPVPEVERAGRHDGV